MKKISFTLLIILCFYNCIQNVNGQINLVHTFTDTGVSAGKVQFCEDANCYIAPLSVTYNPSLGGTSTYATSTLKIYNTDFSLYKTTTFSTNSGFSSYYPSFVSTHIFNNDDKIEFLVESTGSNPQLLIFNEDGELLKDFGVTYPLLAGEAVSWKPSLFKIGTNYFFSLVRQIQINSTGYRNTEIYSLPGTAIINSESSQVAENNAKPFPNPSKTEIYLPYKLKQGDTSNLYIYNENGKLVTEKKVDYVFDKVILDVSNYKKGIYIYKINDITNKFTVN